MKVRIEVKGNKEEGQIILTPGQRAELNKNNGRLTVKQVDANWMLFGTII